jgi:aspartyl-tRNA synthetase
MTYQVGVGFPFFEQQLDAFRHGAKAHCGIAAGLDRLAMLLCGADSLRDVIALPKTQKGTDLRTDAQSQVSTKQLDELHFALVGVESKEAHRANSGVN